MAWAMGYARLLAARGKLLARPCFVGVGLASLLFALASPARADFVEYRLPGTDLVILLQGSARVNPGATVSLTHPKFGALYFALNDVRVTQVPTSYSLFDRKLNTAIAAKDADQAMDAADWALNKGLLHGFYKGVDRALMYNPSHVRALAVTRIKEKIAQSLPEETKAEDELRSLVQKSDMKVRLSEHYILLHDTPAAVPEGRKANRAQERLELLERVYESFLLKFYSRGVELKMPTERMKVVLFNKHEDYLNFATRLDPGLQSAAGFWDSRSNVAVFYDQASDSAFESLRQLSAKYQQFREEAIRRKLPQRAEIIRLANTMIQLVNIKQEDQDVSVVSHEATHQMAGNTGLLPRGLPIPVWVHEGLATYFEAPNDAIWAGIGAVNAQRLRWYRALENDRTHSNIDFIVGDQIFTHARTTEAALHGYGQSWALTHYLMEHHFDQLIDYYRRLAQFKPNDEPTAEQLTTVFNAAFGSTRATLDSRWRQYMSTLQTDQDRWLTESR